MELELPRSADEFVNTFRATQAYILINMDGPAIQPGSRTYRRSWIRDGALTSTGLLYTGHPEPVREFIEWFSPAQFEDGKIPCVVDRRGPDPVPEHDSHGEYIYLLWRYYQFTHDRELLERYLPRVEKAVDYIESLCAQRMTDEYRDGTPLQQACYGLVPESISHEGYSAKPMHSYWDDFWVLRGLNDATAIANELDRGDLEERFSRLRDTFRANLATSFERTLELHDINFIPGCVELGDFDATSTTIALYPCEAQGVLPPAALQQTFDRYFDFFKQRRDGHLEWEAYTPYEVRVIGTFVRLGQPHRAHALIEYFMKDRRPPAWCQWAEVVWRERWTPKFIGDLPHTWVGSDFLSAARSMFVYEDDGAVLIGAGVESEWLNLAAGVTVRRFPTTYGTVSYRAWRDSQGLHFDFEAADEVPRGGFVLAFPGTMVAVDVTGDCDPAPEVVDGRVVLRSLRAVLTIRSTPMLREPRWN